MDEPLIWNSLDEAAAWLTQATAKPWSVKAVLDAEINRVKSVAKNGEIPRPLIKIVMPRSTSFGRYKIKKGQYMREGEAFWRGPVPLALSHLHDLLLHGSTRVGLVQSPEDDDGERESVFIDSIEDEHIADMKQAGIKGDDLKYLLDFIKNEAEPVAASKEDKPLSTKERTTLLTIIAALAKEAKIDISKPSKAADLIADMTQRLGSPVGKRTIEEKLKLIDDAVENRAKP
jgi:hypothetical protein